MQHFKGKPLVIDFGGFVESRIIEAAKLADITVVPLSYQSTADLMPAVKTVATIQEHCKSVILLINNTGPEHVADLEAVLAKRFPTVPVLVVSPSRYVRRLADDGLTIQEIAALGGLEAYQLRNILPQVDKLYALLDKARKRKS